VAKNANAASFTLALDPDGWYRSAPPGDTTAPTVPTNVSVAVGGQSSLTVSWTASTDVQSGVAYYTVYRATSAAGTYSSIGTTLLTSFTDTALTASTTYWYKVSATDAAETPNTSAQSSAASGTTSAAPSGDVTMIALHYDDFNATPLDSSKTSGDGKRWSIADDFNTGQDTTLAVSTNHSRYNTGSGTQRSARMQLTMHNGSAWYSISNGTQAPHRNELRLRPWSTTGWDGRTRLGREYWAGFSIYLPDGSDADPEWVAGSALGRHFEILHQWHDTPDAGVDQSRNPPLNIKINNPNGAGGALSRGHWVVQTLSQSAAAGTLQYDSNVAIDCGAIATGEWTDFVVRYRPHYTTAGILQVWINDVLVVSRIGIPNAYNDTFGPYACLGIYCGQAQGAPSGSIPGDWPAQRVCYYDEWRLYEAVGNPAAAVDTSNTAYQTVKPRGLRNAGT